MIEWFKTAEREEGSAEDRLVDQVIAPSLRPPVGVMLISGSTDPLQGFNVLRRRPRWYTDGSTSYLVGSSGGYIGLLEERMTAWPDWDVASIQPRAAMRVVGYTAAKVVHRSHRAATAASLGLDDIDD